MNYPHLVRVTRAGGITQGTGSQDEDTGAWTPDPQSPGGADVIYEGAADVQDKNSVAARDAGGFPIIVSDAVVFLNSNNAAHSILPDDTIEVIWEDGTHQSGTVIRSVRLDQSLHVRF